MREIADWSHADQRGKAVVEGAPGKTDLLGNRLGAPGLIWSAVQESERSPDVGVPHTFEPSRLFFWQRRYIGTHGLHEQQLGKPGDDARRGKLTFGERAGGKSHRRLDPVARGRLPNVQFQHRR